MNKTATQLLAEMESEAEAEAVSARRYTQAMRNLEEKLVSEIPEWNLARRIETCLRENIKRYGEYCDIIGADDRATYTSTGKLLAWMQDSPGDVFTLLKEAESAQATTSYARRLTDELYQLHQQYLGIDNAAQSDMLPTGLQQPSLRNTLAANQEKAELVNAVLAILPERADITIIDPECEEYIKFAAEFHDTPKKNQESELAI